MLELEKTRVNNWTETRPVFVLIFWLLFPRLDIPLKCKGVKTPHILNLCTAWRWLISFAPQPFLPRRMSPWVRIGQDSDLDTEEKITIYHPAGNRTPIVNEITWDSILNIRSVKSNNLLKIVVFTIFIAITNQANNFSDFTAPFFLISVYLCISMDVNKDSF